MLSKPSALLLPFAVLLLAVAGCAPAPQPETAAPVPTLEAPVRTTVTDVPAFEAFVATQPTPDALRQRYPGLQVVMPGDITTRELRSDNSRYFADLDPEGRVIGGRFQ